MGKKLGKGKFGGGETGFTGGFCEIGERVKGQGDIDFCGSPKLGGGEKIEKTGCAINFRAIESPPEEIMVGLPSGGS